APCTPLSSLAYFGNFRILCSTISPGFTIRIVARGPRGAFGHRPQFTPRPPPGIQSSPSHAQRRSPPQCVRPCSLPVLIKSSGTNLSLLRHDEASMTHVEFRVALTESVAERLRERLSALPFKINYHEEQRG